MSSAVPASDERLHSLDILRGFALYGMVLVGWIIFSTFLTLPVR